MPPNPPASSGGQGGGGGGVLGTLKRKVGPQPLWAWMAEILGVALAYALYKQRQAGSTSSTSATGTTVPADQVPDVIIQNQGPATTGPTTGTTTGTTSSTPPAAPGGTTAASSAPVISQGRVTKVNNNDATITWAATGANQFRLTTNGPGFKNHTSTVNGTTGQLSGLQAGHTYTVNVQPLVNGVPTGNSGTIDIVTTKTK